MDELENKMLNLLNASNLPTECKAYVLKHVYTLCTHVMDLERLKIKIKEEEKHEQVS